MAYLIQGSPGSTGTNPVLDLYTYISGLLTDAVEVQGRILDITSDANRALYFAGNKNAIQVFPAAPGTFYVLDIVNLVGSPTPGHKLSTGHYYFPYTPGTTDSTGDYIIEWTYKQELGGPDAHFCEEFVLITEGQIITGLSKLEKIRLIMQDAVTKNELLEELEYSDQQISLALEMAAGKFNVTPITTCYTVDNFPKCFEYLLCIGAVANLLRSTSFQQLRNQLTYTDGNIHVGLTDKHRDYLNAGSTLFQEYDQAVRGIKNQMNNDAAWGDSASPYLSVGYGFYGAFGGGNGWGGA